MPRNIFIVIEEIISYVPETIDNYDNFIMLLKKIETRVLYTAPEIHGSLWQKLGFICYNFLDKYNGTDWEYLVRKTLNPKNAKRSKETIKRTCSICGSHTHIKSNRKFHPSEDDLNETQGEVIVPADDIYNM